MQLRGWIVACALLGASPSLQAATLAEAMHQAEQAHPLLREAQRAIEASEGLLSEKAAAAYNPEVSLEPQSRRLRDGGSTRDWYLGLSMGVETGGKRNYRRQVAAAERDARLEQRRQLRQRLAIGAARAFVELYFARKALRYRERQASMLAKLQQAMHQRQRLGDASRLQWNLARAASDSAASALMVARQRVNQAQVAYRESLGGSSASMEEEIVLPPLDIAWKPPADARRVALRSRPELAVLAQQKRRDEARLRLAEANMLPDPTISLMLGKEAGDRLLKLGVQIPLPIRNDHRGARAAALAESLRAEEARRWRKRQIELRVQAALRDHAEAMRMLDAMRQERNGDAEDTIRLAEAAFHAGELDLEDLVVHVKQALDARLTSLETERLAWQARIGLAEALGHPEYVLQGVSQ